MKLDLHIERLILDGLPLDPGQGAQLQAALVQELTRLFAQTGWSPPRRLQSGALARVAGGEFVVTPGNSPRQMGRQIASALFASVGGLGDQRR